MPQCQALSYLPAFFGEVDAARTLHAYVAISRHAFQRRGHRWRSNVQFFGQTRADRCLVFLKHLPDRLQIIFLRNASLFSSQIFSRLTCCRQHRRAAAASAVALIWCQRIRVRQCSQPLDRAAGAPFSGIRSNRRRLCTMSAFTTLKSVLFSYSPKHSALPEDYFVRRTPCRSPAILVSILIAFGLILGAVILVFVGFAAMAREARH